MLPEQYQLDIYISPLCTSALLHRDQTTLAVWYDDYSELPEAVSVSHCEHRTIRTLRDIIAQIPRALVHMVTIRIVYGGEFSFPEIHHSTSNITPARVFNSETRTLLGSHCISEIRIAPPAHIYTSSLLTGFRVYEYTSRGFPLSENQICTECTLHGIASWVSDSFHNRIERLFYIRGLTGLVYCSAYTSHIEPNLFLVKHRSSLNHSLVFEIGLQQSNIIALQGSIPTTTDRIYFGISDCKSANIQVLGEYIGTHCVQPVGHFDILLVGGSDHIRHYTDYFEQCIDFCRKNIPHYTFTLYYNTIRIREIIELFSLVGRTQSLEHRIQLVEKNHIPYETHF